MILAAEFKNAVKNQDKMKVRIMLKNSMLLDPTMEQFNEMLAYAERNSKDLYDEHDGRPLHNDENAWTKEYMNELLSRVVDNFSRERINLLKKIVQYQYRDRIKKFKTGIYSSNSQVFTTRKILGGGTAVVGLGLVAKGIGMSASIFSGLCVIGGAAAVAVGVSTLISKEDK